MFNRILGSRPAVAVASASMAVAVLGGTAALANHDANVIHACKNKTNGNVRIVNSASDCQNSETPTEWGIQGPQGLQGPTGAPGADGPQGPPGLSGYQRVLGPAVAIPPGAERQLSVSCPAGTRVLSGGASSAPRLFTEDSYPVSDTTWRLYIFNDGTIQQSARPHAVCAAVASSSTQGNVALNTVEGKFEDTEAATAGSSRES